MQKSEQMSHDAAAIFACLTLGSLCLFWERWRENHFSTHLPVWARVPGLLPVAEIQDFRSKSFILSRETKEDVYTKWPPATGQRSTESL